MVERYRPAATPPPKTKRRSTPAAPLFACLPKPILWHPPIAHRGERTDGLLSVFDCAVATAILAQARGSMSAARHRAAMRAGREAAEERRTVGAMVAAHNRDEHMDAPWTFKDHMSEHYGRARSDFVADEVTVMTTRSRLLIVADLSRNGRNQDRLLDALDRLQDPVRVGRAEWPPLLRAVKQVRGKLRLTINRRWLPRVVGAVPLPVPSRGANCLALFLFLAATDQRRGVLTRRNASIETEKLCRLIGIRFRWPAEACAALTGALEAVNAHLRHLNRGGALGRARLPLRYHLRPLDDGARLRFIASYGDDDPTDDRPTTLDEREMVDPELARRLWEAEREHEEAQQQGRERLRRVRERLGGTV